MLVSLQPLLFLLLSHLVASSSSADASQIHPSRELSQEQIGSFTPVTQVTDHAAIDLDQEEIEKHLADQDFSKAAEVYTKGGHSKAFARLELSTPLVFAADKGTPVTGTSVDGSRVKGTVYSDEKKGGTILRVQYATSDIQASYVRCQVGGSSDPVTEGCFAASGTVKVNGGADYPYSYSISKDNHNGRTIQGFSVKNEKHRRNGKGEYYPDFQRFVDYYGSTDYADKWISAALAGANAGLTRGNANFALTTAEGRVEAVKKGTAYLSVFMYVIRELEDAIDDCNNQQCDSRTSCNDDAVHALDEAVAFYAGSLLDEDSNGKLLYSLAEKRCENFNTCQDGNAILNRGVMFEFRAMQDMLLKRQCRSAEGMKNRIVDLMYVPMIQGVLRYAFFSGEQGDNSEKSEAEGATFAAAVLPKIHSCNQEDAQTIYSNMKIGNSAPVDFVAIKKAFERNYDCMNLSCHQIGGLYNGVAYYDKASPCGTSSSSSNVGLAVGVSLGAVAALALFAVFAKRRSSSSSKVEFKTDTPTVEEGGGAV